MKKATLLLLLSCLTALALSAQTKQILGLGKLKLEESTESFLADFVPDNNLEKIYTYAELQHYQSSNVCELVKDHKKNDAGFINSLFSLYNIPDIRMFYIPHYQATPKINQDGVTLVFYQDKLVLITIPEVNENLLAAFNFRYGKPTAKNMGAKGGNLKYAFWNTENDNFCYIQNALSTKNETPKAPDAQSMIICSKTLTKLQSQQKEITNQAKKQKK